MSVIMSLSVVVKNLECPVFIHNTGCFHPRKQKETWKLISSSCKDVHWLGDYSLTYKRALEKKSGA